MTSYAYSNRAELPGGGSKLDTSELSKTHADARADQNASVSSSKMVTEDRPQPQPRPSPDMAHEADRASFDQRWDGEARAARKAAYVAKRRGAREAKRLRGHAKNFNQSVNQTR